MRCRATALCIYPTPQWAPHCGRSDAPPGKLSLLFRIVQLGAWRVSLPRDYPTVKWRHKLDNMEMSSNGSYCLDFFATDPCKIWPTYLGKWKIYLNLDQHQNRQWCLQSCNDAMTLSAAPWGDPLSAPSLVTGCHYYYPGTWDQYWPLRTVSFRHLSVESWAGCEEMMPGPGAGVGLAITPRHLIITPQCQQRREIITLQHSIEYDQKRSP